MAPEQMDGSHAVDHRADVYAMGVLLYELLTGQLPMGRFPPPSQKTAVDPRMDAVVLRALEMEPERRWQSVGEIRTALAALTQGPPPEDPLVEVIPEELPRPRMPVPGATLVAPPVVPVERARLQRRLSVPSRGLL